jgi:uncharacterized repeat protein (TIGR01451 family)
MDPVRPKNLQSPGLRRARRAWGWLCAAALGLGLAPLPVLAGTTPALFESFPRTGDPSTINFVTTGNTLRAGDNASNNSASALVSGLSGNPVNAGSSSETLSGIPAGSTILAAYLYWAGSGSTTDYTVTLNGISVTAPANRQYTETYNAGGGDVLAFFSGAADVTSIVTGNGSYTFAGLNVTNVDVGNVTYLSNQATTAGWSLLVIYSNSAESNRVINIFEGFEAFRNTSINLTMNNFRIPSTGINGKFAVLTWEGDPDAPSNTGETLGLTPGTTLSDACDTNGNQYNSTINTLICTGNAATDDVFYGVDFDTYNVSSMLTSGETNVTTNYTSGNDLVLLSAQVLSVVNTPISDLSISKVHNATFGYGDNESYTLTVTNNGPASSGGTTTTVTDTLPAGETYVSGAGTGWSCGATGQNVTCTSTATVTAGNTFSPITLTVTVATNAGTSLANTATVATTNFDNTSSNNSSTDTVSNAAGTLVHPDLSTSTKTGFSPSGGDIVAGGMVDYVITLTESNGVDASGVSVSDPLDTNLTGLTGVTVSGSSTTASNTSTGTALNLSNITVPANGSVTITFSATVKTGTAACTSVSNTATANYAGGNPNSTTVSYDFVTAQSTCKAKGNKILYVYDSQDLTRVAQTVTTTGVTVGEASTLTWTMNPPFRAAFTLSAGTVTVQLVTAGSGSGNPNNSRNYTVSILKNGTVLGTSASSGNFTSTTLTLRTTTVTVPLTTFAAGDTLDLRVNNNSTGGGTRTIVVAQLAAAGRSIVSFATTTVINVDSVNVYNAAFSATTTTAIYTPNTHVYVCAAISDPFGNADVTSATMTLIDANSVAQVVNGTMVDKGPSNCAGTASTSVEAFEYDYTIPAAPGVANGIWGVTVTGHEGSEGTVTHSGSATFEVNSPSLLIVKSVSVSTDPTTFAIKHSIPGATMQYTIQVQNTGRGTVDNGSLVISDPVPTNTVLVLENTAPSPPFNFVDGAQTSGLGVSANYGSVTYTNHSGASYTPTCTRPCADANIGGFKITLSGTMNGKTGATAPSFSITYQVVIN